MNPLRTGLLAVGLLAAALAAGQTDKAVDDKPIKKGRGKFTISKETTYVTEPVDKDGYIDYARALNQRLRQGVTTQNNANVLLWKAIGPKPEHKTISAEFFQELGMQVPPEKGDYFIDLDRYVMDRLKIESWSEEFKDITIDQLNRAMERPWTTKEYPNLASWLEANEKALALVVEASKRTQYYSPLIPSKTEKGSSGLISALLDPGPQKCRHMAGTLATRAMLRLSQGKYDDAWQDLLACHRLGRLVGRSAFLIDGLIGIAIDGVARRGEIAFLDSARLNAKKLQNCLGDVQMLPPFPGFADKVELGERFVFLDCVMLIDRYGMQSLKALAADALPADPNGLEKAFQKGIDWDEALKNGNLLCDRMSTALREKNPKLRRKTLEKIDEDVNAYLKEQKSKLATPKGQPDVLGGGAKGMGKAIGAVLIGILVPSVDKMHRAWDRVQQEQDNLQVAFVLAWYHCDHGHYPKTLDALAPKYLKQIPQDIFSGKPLIYRPSEKGFLLYSVGYNGKDDGGHGLDDDPPGDDLVIRIPLPELPKK
jgi:hypothetical protein